MAIDGSCSWRVDTVGECPSQEFCGGIAGWQCDPGQTCVDIPDEGCEPGLGGADCLGRWLDSCAEADCGEMPEQAPCPNGGGGPPECLPNDSGVCQWHVPACPDPNPNPHLGAECGAELDLDCGEGLFCLGMESDRCSLTQPGRCALMTEFCNDLYAPVCGCDGQEYSNACVAHGAGVSVAQDGP